MTETALILVPDTITSPRRLVMFCHGDAGDETNILGVNERTLGQACLDRGWVVACSRAELTNWGKQAALDDYHRLIAYCQSTYSTTATLLIGQSMGGDASLLLLADPTLTDVAAWAGVAPVCNLNAMYVAGTYATQIENAYGFSGGWDDTATAGHDPVNDFTGADFAGKYMRFYASASDPTVVKTDNSDAMATLVAGNATESTVVVATGGHLSASHYQPSDLLAFFDRALA